MSGFKCVAARGKMSADPGGEQRRKTRSRYRLQSCACVCPFCCHFYTFQDLLNNLPVSATYHYCRIQTRTAFRTQPREQEPINSVSSPKDLTVSLSVRQQSVPLSLARQEDVSQRGGGEASMTAQSLVNIRHITRPALSRKL